MKRLLRNEIEHFPEPAALIQQFARSPGDRRNSNPEPFGDIPVGDMPAQELYYLPAGGDFLKFIRSKYIGEKFEESRSVMTRGAESFNELIDPPFPFFPVCFTRNFMHIFHRTSTIA